MEAGKSAEKEIRNIFEEMEKLLNGGEDLEYVKVSVIDLIGNNAVIASKDLMAKAQEILNRVNDATVEQVEVFLDGTLLGVDEAYGALYHKNEGAKWIRMRQEDFNEIVKQLRKDGKIGIFDEIAKRNFRMAMVVSNFLARSMDTKTIGKEYEEILKKMKKRREGE